jgi:hypothetical protein
LGIAVINPFWYTDLTENTEKEYLLNISGQSLTQSRRDAKQQRFLNKNRVFAIKP